MNTPFQRAKKLTEHGQGAIEYLGIATLVAVVIAALVATPIAPSVGKGLELVTCKISHLSATNVAYSPIETNLTTEQCPLSSPNNTGQKNSGQKNTFTSTPQQNHTTKQNPVAGTPADVSPQGFHGPFVEGDDGYIYDSNGDRVPYSNSSRRPDYGDHQVEDVWTQSRNQQLDDIKNGDLPVDENGFVPTQLDDDQMYVMDINGNWRDVTWKPGQSRAGKWDMGHKAGHEYRKTYKQYMDGSISKEQFLEIYQDPTNYKVEDPQRNQSHVDEDKSG